MDVVCFLAWGHCQLVPLGPTAVSHQPATVSLATPTAVLLVGSQTGTMAVTHQGPVVCIPLLTAIVPVLLLVDAVAAPAGPGHEHPGWLAAAQPENPGHPTSRLPVRGWDI